MENSKNIHDKPTAADLYFRPKVGFAKKIYFYISFYTKRDPEFTATVSGIIAYHDRAGVFTIHSIFSKLVEEETEMNTYINGTISRARDVDFRWSKVKDLQFFIHNHKSGNLQYVYDNLSKKYSCQFFEIPKTLQSFKLQIKNYDRSFNDIPRKYDGFSDTDLFFHLVHFRSPFATTDHRLDFFSCVTDHDPVYEVQEKLTFGSNTETRKINVCNKSRIFPYIQFLFANKGYTKIGIGSYHGCCYVEYSIRDTNEDIDKGEKVACLKVLRKLLENHPLFGGTDCYIKVGKNNLTVLYVDFVDENMMICGRKEYEQLVEGLNH